jgi:hypothetical protein
MKFYPLRIRSLQKMSSVSRASTAIISSVVFTSLAACLVLARLIARLAILKIAGRDELAITVSLVSRDQTFTPDVLHSSCAQVRDVFIFNVF